MGIHAALTCSQWVDAGQSHLTVDVLGLLSQVWKLKDVSNQYTQQTVDKWASVAVTVTK